MRKAGIRERGFWFMRKTGTRERGLRSRESSWARKDP